MADPQKMTIDQDRGDILITDRANNAILAFHRGGAFIGVYKDRKISRPSGIAVKEDYIYLGNTGSNNILKIEKVDFEKET